MKRKHFYSHLVETTHITLEIAELDVTSGERVHLLSLVEANIHTTVVSKVLDELDPLDKKKFLSNLSLLMYGFNEQQELRISNVILDNFHNIIPTLTDEELKRFREITKFNIERV